MRVDEGVLRDMLFEWGIPNVEVALAFLRQMRDQNCRAERAGRPTEVTYRFALRDGGTIDLHYEEDGVDPLRVAWTSGGVPDVQVVG